MLKKKDIILIIFALLINLPILFFTTYRTDKTITLPGGTNSSSDIISVSDANLNGSYNTVYVITFDHSTLFQNFICQFFEKVEVEEMPEHYLHISLYESYLMGKIQHESSIMTSIISSYNEASKIDQDIKIDYSLDSLVVSFYLPNSSFKIGDRIIGINDIMIDDEGFKESFNNRRLNDTLIIKRDEELLELKLDNNNYNAFSFYPYYDIKNIIPDVTISQGNTLGPSGGLMRSLSLVDSLLDKDYAKGRKIAGTGTIDIYGNVGKIGGIKQKIYTAYADSCDIFLCPEKNYEEALEAYNNLPSRRMKLVKVSTLSEALEVLDE